jgi:hypothetical protein
MGSGYFRIMGLDYFGIMGSGYFGIMGLDYFGSLEPIVDINLGFTLQGYGIGITDRCLGRVAKV